MLTSIMIDCQKHQVPYQLAVFFQVKKPFLAGTALVYPRARWESL